MPAAELPACVFCGEPIAPGEETAGRAPMAAHAACADAALADDSHWDAISAAGGDTGDDESTPPATPARRAGCLGSALALGATVALLAISAAGIGALT